MLRTHALRLLFGAIVVGGTSPAAASGAPDGRPTVPDSLSRVTLHVEGMTCGGCTIATRKVLLRLPGVVRADVSYEERRAVIVYDPAKVTVAQMIAAVRTLGYTATIAVPRAAPPGGTPTP